MASLIPLEPESRRSAALPCRSGPGRPRPPPRHRSDEDVTRVTRRSKRGLGCKKSRAAASPQQRGAVTTPRSAPGTPAAGSRRAAGRGRCGRIHPEAAGPQPPELGRAARTRSGWAPGGGCGCAAAGRASEATCWPGGLGQGRRADLLIGGAGKRWQASELRTENRWLD